MEETNMRLRMIAVTAAVGLMGLLLGSCVSDGRQAVQMEPGDPAEEAAVSAPAEGESASADPFAAWGQGPLEGEFRRDYEREEVDVRLAQFFKLLMSHDYFGQFTRGDPVFEDYLVTYFGLEGGPYYLGRGVERTVYDQDETVRSRYRRVLIDEEGENGESRWWQIRHLQNGEEYLYETLVGPYGVPREIRYRQPGREGYGSRGTSLGEAVVRAEERMSPQEIRDRLAEQRRSEMDGGMIDFYEGIEETSRETITAAGRKVYTIRLEGEMRSEDAGTVAVFYSPDVPGGIVRITMAGQVYAEITGWIDDGRRIIEPDMVQGGGAAAAADTPGSAEAAAAPAESEGSPSAPVRLTPGSPHRGSVAAGETSYYTVPVSSRSDVVVELTGLDGAAALYSFGSDSSFDQWRTGSEGGTPSITEYFVPKGGALYFTVEPMSDRGLQYTVQVRSDQLLDPLGVRTRGDYRSRTEPLQQGENRLLVLPGALNYYELPVQEQDSVTLKVAGLQEGAASFDFLTVADGSYAGLSGMQRSPSEKEISLQGLQSGSTLYFYLVASEQARERELTVTVE
jgi:hypothetical protein